MRIVEPAALPPRPATVLRRAIADYPERVLLLAALPVTAPGMQLATMGVVFAEVGLAMPGLEAVRSALKALRRVAPLDHEGTAWWWRPSPAMRIEVSELFRGYFG